jgi:hypothetical protein
VAIEFAVHLVVIGAERECEVVVADLRHQVPLILPSAIVEEMPVTRDAEKRPQRERAEARGTA